MFSSNVLHVERSTTLFANSHLKKIHPQLLPLHSKISQVVRKNYFEMLEDKPSPKIDFNPKIAAGFGVDLSCRIDDSTVRSQPDFGSIR